MRKFNLTYTDDNGREIKFTGDLKQIISYLIDTFISNG